MKKQKTDGKLSCAKLGIQGEASSRRYAKSYRKNKKPTYRIRAPRAHGTCLHSQNGKEN